MSFEPPAADPVAAEPSSTPPDWSGLPIPDDTVDLRTGPGLSARLLALLPLVGQWAGTGQWASGSEAEPTPVGLALAFAHDGRDFLSYDARLWALAAEGEPARPTGRESGYWRRGFHQDAVEVALADSAGAITILTGVAGDARWELATDSVAAAPTGRPVQAERRLYAVVRDSLMLISEQKVGDAWVPLLTAQLTRVR